MAFNLSVFVQTGPQLSFDFTNTTGLWQQLGQDIDGEAVDDGSGESVSLSVDGLTVTIGDIRVFTVLLQLILMLRIRGSIGSGCYPHRRLKSSKHY